MPGLLREIKRELTRRGLNENLRRLEADKYSRYRRKRQPTVITWNSEIVEDDAFYYLKPPPGSVQLFWAQPGSPIIKELETSYSSQDIPRLEALSERIVKDVKSKPIVPVSEAVKEVLERPIYFDLNYASKELAAYLAFPDDIEIANLLFAYNGGTLHDEDFGLYEYYLKDKSEEELSGYETLVVISPPNLSEIEKEILLSVPEDQLDLNIASTINVANWVTVVHFVRVIVAITVTGNTIDFHKELESLPVLPEMTVNELGAIQSANELLNMRREVFEKFQR